MSVASGGSASSLTERARAASSSSRPDDDATLRFNRVDGGGDGRKGAIPVYVMLPLDTVSRDGRLQRVDALSAQLARLASAGVAGVMVDVWWGIVERARPMEYDWDAYLQLASIVGSLGLKLHAVLSFHARGANRDDDYHVPLPSWVTDAVNRDPDGLLFMDRAGTRSDEYISLFADDSPMPMLASSSSSDALLSAEAANEPLVPPRTPIDCYRDMMISFRDAFREYISPPNAVVDEILVGAGPCGELRYPAYAMSRGWEFPGVGEFQCYDRRALESLAAAANAVGRPEWGGAGPHDAGSYNSHPDDTGFFADGRGEQGETRERRGERIPSHYSHSRSSTNLASSPISRSPSGNPLSRSPSSQGSPGGSPRPGDGEWPRRSFDGRRMSYDAPHRRSLDSLAAADTPVGRWDSDYGRFFLTWYSDELVSHGERVLTAAREAFDGVGARLAIKCAGIHWWYRTRAHAAELTTGYYNASAHGDAHGDAHGGDGGALRGRMVRNGSRRVLYAGSHTTASAW